MLVFGILQRTRVPFQKCSYFMWPIISINADITVYSSGMLSAVYTNSTSLKLAMNVFTSLLICHTLIIVTIFRFVMTIAF